MSTFSLKSADSRFDFEFQHSEENKPSKLIITVNDSVGEPASVLELSKAIYDYCFGKRTNSFNLKGIKELPLSVIVGTVGGDHLFHGGIGLRSRKRQADQLVYAVAYKLPHFFPGPGRAGELGQGMIYGGVEIVQSIQQGAVQVENDTGVHAIRTPGSLRSGYPRPGRSAGGSCPGDGKRSGGNSGGGSPPHSDWWR